MAAVFGDLRTLRLAELVAEVATSGNDGALAITSGKRHKTFLIGTRGVGLESTEERPALSLGDALLELGLATAEGIERAQAEAAKSGRPLADACMALGLADRAAVDQALRLQVEAEFFDAAGWEDARYEFHTGRRSSGASTSEKKRTRFIAASNRAAPDMHGRLDAWLEIRRRVPGMAWVMAPAEGFAVDHYADAERAVAAQVDGTRTVAAICADARIPRFDACGVLARAVDQGHLRARTPDEVGALAVAAAQAGRMRQAHDMLQLALAQAPDRHQLRLRLAEVLGAMGRGAEAAAEYLRLAEVKVTARDLAGAVEILRVATAADPAGLEAPGRWFALALANPRELGATPATMVRDFFPHLRALATAGRMDEARDGLRRLVALAPTDRALRQAEMTLLVSLGDSAAAASAQAGLAAGLAAAGDRAGAIAAYRAAAGLDPSNASVRTQLAALEAAEGAGRPSGGGAPGVGTAARARPLPAPAVRSGAGGSTVRRSLAAAAIVLGLGCVVVTWRVLAAGGTPVSPVGPAPGAGAAALADPGPADAHVTEARRRLTAGDHAGALAAFRSAVAAGGGSDPAAPAAEVGRLEALERDATTRRAEAEALESGGDVAGARAAWASLLATHAGSAAAAAIRLPVEVVSWPSGADVWEGDTTVGRTPHVARVAPGATRTLILRRHGFAPVTVTVVPEAGARVEIRLEHVPVWEASPGGAIASLASGGEARLLVGGRDSQFTALAGDDGRRLWSVATGLMGEVTGAPIEAPDAGEGAAGRRVVLAAGRNGQIRAVDAADGTVRWSHAVEGPVDMPLAPDPARARLIVASGRGVIVALALADGSVAWRGAVGRAVHGGPVVVGDRVVLATGSGEIIALDALTGSQVWRANPAGEVHGLAPAGETVIAAVGPGLVALGVDGLPRWTARTPAPVVTPPVVSGGTAVVGLGDGSLAAFEAAGGTLQWRCTLPGRAVGRAAHAQVSGRGQWFAATQAGTLHAIADDGTERWHVRIAGGAWATGPVSDGRLVVCAAPGGRLLAYLAE